MQSFKEFNEAVAHHAIYSHDGKQWHHETDFKGTSAEAKDEVDSYKRPGQKAKSIKLKPHQVNSKERDHDKIAAGH